MRICQGRPDRWLESMRLMFSADSELPNPQPCVAQRACALYIGSIPASALSRKPAARYGIPGRTTAGEKFQRVPAEFAGTNLSRSGRARAS